MKLHFSLLALIAFFTVTAGFKDGSLIMISVFLHESAHLMTMIFFKQPPKEVLLSAFGMRIVLAENKTLDYRKSISISLAGPLSNLMLAAIAYAMGNKTLWVMNLSIGLMHLLPIEPLDGGLALHSLLCLFLKKESAEKVSLFTSFILLFPICTLGFLVLLYSKNNFSLLLLALYLMSYLLVKKRSYVL